MKFGSFTFGSFSPSDCCPPLGSTFWWVRPRQFKTQSHFTSGTSKLPGARHGCRLCHACVLEALNMYALNALVQRPCWYLLGASDTAATKRCIGADVPHAEDVVLWVVLNCGKMFKRDHNAMYVMNACIIACWWVFTIGAHCILRAGKNTKMKRRISFENWRPQLEGDDAPRQYPSHIRQQLQSRNRAAAKLEKS